jgi:hypothetical protein
METGIPLLRVVTAVTPVPVVTVPSRLVTPLMVVSMSSMPYVDISPSSQPDQALSSLNYGITPICNLSQSRYGCTPIACAHTTGNSNTHLSQVSYINLLIYQYKQVCNQCEHSHTQVYHNLNTNQLHRNAPYKHLSASVSTLPVERTN